VFVLEDIPKAEIALLFAETYPESFVVAKPAVDRLKFVRTEMIHDSNFFLGWETESISIPGKSDSVNLPQYLILHKQAMTASDEIPEPIDGAPLVQLRWDVIETKTPPPNFAQKTLGHGMGFLTILTMGSVWPPPTSTRAFPTKQIITKTQKLYAKVRNNDERSILAQPKAEREFFSGFFWGLFFIPFPERDRTSYFSEGGFGDSPGGWSNCLEQLFNDVETVEYLDSCTEAGLEARNEWFAELHKEHAYSYEQLPLKYSYASHGAFVFKSAQDPSLGKLKWNGIENGMNQLICTQRHR